MASFDGENVFSSGPSQFEVHGWRVAARREGFPGLDGVRQLVLGARGRVIQQRGYLEHATGAGLAALVAAIDQYQKVCNPCDLVDNNGNTYPNTVITALRHGPARRSGSSFVAPYEIDYLQLTEE